MHVGPAAVLLPGDWRVSNPNLNTLTRHQVVEVSQFRA